MDDGQYQNQACPRETDTGECKKVGDGGQESFGSFKMSHIGVAYQPPAVLFFNGVSCLLGYLRGSGSMGRM